jgi:hypothetical protein
MRYLLCILSFNFFVACIELEEEKVVYSLESDTADVAEVKTKKTNIQDIQIDPLPNGYEVVSQPKYLSDLGESKAFIVTQDTTILYGSEGEDKRCLLLADSVVEVKYFLSTNMGSMALVESIECEIYSHPEDMFHMGYMPLGDISLIEMDAQFLEEREEKLARLEEDKIALLGE